MVMRRDDDESILDDPEAMMLLRGAGLMAASITISGVDGVGIDTRRKRTLELADEFVEYIIGDEEPRKKG